MSGSGRKRKEIDVPRRSCDASIDRALLLREMDANRATSWQIRVEGGVIYCKFVGPTPTDEISGFLQALVAAMPESSARLVFDLRELEGYNSETKAPIKRWLLQHKLAISELTVLVPKSGTILKVVTAAVALAAGVKIQIREDIEERATCVTH